MTMPYRTGTLALTAASGRTEAADRAGEHMQVTLGEWLAIGTVTVDADRRLLLAGAPSSPGIYRLRLLGVDPCVYIGAAEDLRRRFEGDWASGPGPQPDRRMGDEILDVLWNHQHVAVEICLQGLVEVGACREPLDLAVRSHRLLGVEAALDQARTAGFGRVKSVDANQA